MLEGFFIEPWSYIRERSPFGDFVFVGFLNAGRCVAFLLLFNCTNALLLAVCLLFSMSLLPSSASFSSININDEGGPFFLSDRGCTGGFLLFNDNFCRDRFIPRPPLDIVAVLHDKFAILFLPPNKVRFLFVLFKSKELLGFNLLLFTLLLMLRLLLLKAPLVPIFTLSLLVLMRSLLLLPLPLLLSSNEERISTS